MSKLTKLLEYNDASYYNRKKMLGKPSFAKMLGKSYHRELLSSEAKDDGEILLQREILETIVKGADYNKVIRDMIPVVKSKTGYKGRIVTHDHVSKFADIVPEAGQIPVHDSSYGHKDVDYKKFATRIQISEELIEDSRWDEVELELILAGCRIENALNRYALGVMLDGCSVSDIDGLSTSKLVEGIEDLEDEYFSADSLLLHPNGSYNLYSGDVDFFAVNISRHNIADEKSTIYGLKQMSLSMDTTIDFTAKWDSTDTANHYYGFLFDSMHYARLIIRNGIETNDIKVFKNDYQDLVAKLRAGVAVTHPKAGVRFLTA